MKRASLLVLMLSSVAAASAAAQTKTILSDLPVGIDTRASYLIYLHGRIIEEKGARPTDERFGVYEYQQILDTLATSGATVIAEQRPLNTEFRQFGAHVADQVRRLLAAGVPAQRISVVGFSKGGGIAIITSALLADDRINYVFLGACGDWVLNRADVNVRGRILSIYEKSDELGTSCQPLFTQARATRQSREVVLETGLGHGAFYRPHKAWLEPLFAWVKPERQAGRPE
jgi:hypothetical protein